MSEASSLRREAKRSDLMSGLDNLTILRYSAKSPGTVAADAALLAASYRAELYGLDDEHNAEEFAKSVIQEAGEILGKLESGEPVSLSILDLRVQWLRRAIERMQDCQEEAQRHRRFCDTKEGA